MLEDRRTRCARFKISLLVEGRIPATPIAGLLLDISLTGCLLETTMTPGISQGATIRLMVPGLTALAGQIAWCAGTRCGVRFNREMANEELIRIRRHSDELASSKVVLNDGFGRPLPSLRAGRKRR